MSGQRQNCLPDDPPKVGSSEPTFDLLSVAPLHSILVFDRVLANQPSQ